MSEYKAILNTKEYIVKTQVFNVVTSCSDATVTATNSQGDNLGSTTAPSGGTGNIPIADTRINKSDGTPIASTPSTVPYNVADSVIEVEYQDGTPISTTNVKATENAVIQVPNIPIPYPFKTGETTSYITGDDGDLQEGRGVDWLTLDDGSPRFVIDPVYPTIFHDRAWGLSWRNIIVGSKTQAGYIAEAASLTDGGLPAGSWRLPNWIEAATIMKMVRMPLNYPPINYDQVTSGLIRFITSNAGYSDPANNMLEYLIFSAAGLGTGFTISTVTNKNTASAINRTLYVTNTVNFV